MGVKALLVHVGRHERVKVWGIRDLVGDRRPGALHPGAVLDLLLERLAKPDG